MWQLGNIPGPPVFHNLSSCRRTIRVELRGEESDRRGGRASIGLPTSFVLRDTGRKRSTYWLVRYLELQLGETRVSSWKAFRTLFSGSKSKGKNGRLSRARIGAAAAFNRALNCWNAAACSAW